MPPVHRPSQPKNPAEHRTILSQRRWLEEKMRLMNQSPAGMRPELVEQWAERQLQQNFRRGK